MSHKPILEGASISGLFSSQIIGDLLWFASFKEVVPEQGRVPFVSDTMLIHRVNDAVDAQQKKRAFAILALLDRSFPACVARRIMSVIILSAKAMAMTWTSTDCSQKIQITIRSKPFVTHCYSATAPLWIAFIFFVIASVFHCGPGAIFWSPYIIAAFTVYAVAQIWNRDSFPVQTSARLAPAFDKHSGANGFFIAAITSAFPKSSAHIAAREVLFYDGPSSESASCEFLERSHDINIGTLGNKFSAILFT